MEGAVGIMEGCEAEDEGIHAGRQMKCRVRIKEARGLPVGLAHFVFCQYAWWGGGETVVVPPALDAEATPAGQV